MTWSVWLPLALCQLIRSVRGAFGGDPCRTSELLESMMLPKMAAAAREDERIEEQRQTIARFGEIQRRFNREES